MMIKAIQQKKIKKKLNFNKLNKLNKLKNNKLNKQKLFKKWNLITIFH